MFSIINSILHTQKISSLYIKCFFSTNYAIKITTSKRRNSSIQSPAYIQLIGNTSESSLIPLNPPQSEFRQGSLTLFSIDIPQTLGDLEKIKIHHHDKNTWRVLQIDIENMKTNQKWRFPVYSSISSLLYNKESTILYPSKETPITNSKERILSLMCGVSSLSHDINHINEDSSFVIDRNCVSNVSPYHAIGVADGVSEWKTLYNKSASEYSKQLMNICEDIIYERDTVTPLAVITQAKQIIDQLNVSGACTCGLGILHRSQYTFNSYIIGDVKYMIIRKGKILYISESQQHSFGYPYQLSSNHDKNINKGICNSISVQSGDLILYGSDGLFDNLYENVLCNHLWRLRYANPSLIATYLTGLAKDASISKTEDTPWSKEASEEFNLIYKGGKEDDITAIVGKIVSERRTL